MKSDIIICLKGRIHDEAVVNSIESARHKSYSQRYPPDHDHLRSYLGKLSLALFEVSSFLEIEYRKLIPLQNVFVRCFGEFEFDHYAVLVVDALLEWENGVWKQILVHLIRILDSHHASSKPAKLDRRYAHLLYSP